MDNEIGDNVKDEMTYPLEFGKRRKVALSGAGVTDLEKGLADDKVGEFVTLLWRWHVAYDHS